MRYYAHFGHRDFVLCLGYKADVIKEYFLRYNEALSNDFVLSAAGARSSSSAATSTTGASPSWTPASTREPRPAPAGGPAPPRGRGDLPGQLRRHADRRAAGPARRAVPGVGRDRRVRDRPAQRYTFHLVDHGRGRPRRGHRGRPHRADMWINGGYFMFRREIFDYIQPGEELVEEPFRRLDRRWAAPRPSATTGSGRRWTRSRTCRTSRRMGGRRPAVGALARTREPAR